MKKIIKHICTSLLALLVLCSTFSFTINEHICGGQKMSMAIGIEAENCGMEVAQIASDQTTIQQTPCCNDISTFIQGQQELQTNYDDITFTSQIIITAFVYHYIFVLPTVDEEKTVYKPYIPPPLVKDIQLLDETFLI
ncbi:HYC_CC_PP family protein [Kordia jejudonensis]|uniref:HYC_CC_PP family protein n=1 Tax=Kordia jejudonensis TaxID=1348245 RepID=UPI0006294C84|nr:hypothetical protein [Kordia jejudonensis]